jgi:hypothetical protein
MVMVMEAVYEKETYAKSGHPDWTAKASKPNYVVTPKQGFNECGYYVLQFARTFDGESFVEHIATQDVYF